MSFYLSIGANIIVNQSSPLCLSFGGRKANQLQPGAIFIAPSCTKPSAAFIDMECIQNSRFDYITKPGCRSKWINKQRYKDWYQLKPPNPIEDPYIVAILIALAQAQRCQVYTRDGILSLQTKQSVGNNGPASQDLQQFTVLETTSPKLNQNSCKVCELQSKHF